MINIIDDYDEPIVHCQPNIIEKIKSIKYVMNVNMKTVRGTDETVRAIHKIFKTKNRENIKKELFELIKFT